MATAQKPTLAVAIGDPAGIGPELAARAVVDPDLKVAARLILIGDRRVFARGAAEAGLDIDVATIGAAQPLPGGDAPAFIDLQHLDPATVPLGEAKREGGEFALSNFKAALELAKAGKVDAVCFTPFNKAAMKKAHPSYEDEIGYTAEILGRPDIVAKEFNILEGLWNARVTSHVPISAVAGMITHEAVLSGIRLTNASLLEAGLATPRIAVAGLNPHCGDGGNFGTEDDEILRPAVEVAQEEGIKVDGPFPSDTVFVRATKGQFDAVLTMYHDQGQIAMKLIGFDKGVTLLGGFPFPICTPAHGSAYDIAGRGIANPGATRAAILLAAKMVGRRGEAARAA